MSQLRSPTGLRKTGLKAKLRAGLKAWSGPLALVLLIGAGALWIGHAQRQRVLTREPLLAELLNIEPAAITSITLWQARPDPQEPVVIVLSRRDGQWYVVTPFEAPADPRAVAQVINVLYRPSLAQYPVEAVNRTAARLDAPPLRVTFDQQSVIFGTTDPILQRRYCQIGATVHLLKDDFTHHLTQPAERFRMPPSRSAARLDTPPVTKPHGVAPR